MPQSWDDMSQRVFAFTVVYFTSCPQIGVSLVAALSLRFMRLSAGRQASASYHLNKEQPEGHKN